jgi:hypothetical protein
MDNDNTEPVTDPQASLLRTHIEAGKARILDGSGPAQDSFLFLSAPHEAMPKLAFMDPILDPVDKTVWANIWIYAKEQGLQGAGFPSHKVLMSRCNIRQRRKIIQSITLLRLCRWVTLCEQVFDTTTGTFRGNIYALHDEPAPLSLTQQLDPGYMAFLEYCIRHKDRRIHRIAANISESIDSDLLQGRDLLSHDPAHQHDVRLAAVSAILARERGEIPSRDSENRAAFFTQAVEPLLESKTTETETEEWRDPNRPSKNHQVQKTDTVNHRVQLLHTVISPPETPKLPGSESAHGNLSPNHRVHNSAHGDSERSSSSSSIFLEKTTTTNTGGNNHRAETEKPPAAHCSDQALIRPPELTDNEYALALRRIQKMTLEEQQNLLDELGEQIRQRKDTSNPVRNPIGYLNWLCQQIEEGRHPLSSAHLNRQERRQREIEQQERERRQALKAEKELARMAGELAQRKKS